NIVIWNDWEISAPSQNPLALQFPVCRSKSGMQEQAGAESLRLLTSQIIFLWTFFLITPATAQTQDTASLYQAGVQAFQRGDCEAALEYFSDMTDAENLNDVAFFSMARVSYLMEGKKNLERTIEYARTAIRLNPTEYSYQKFLASIYLQRFAKSNDEQDAKMTEDQLMSIITAVPGDSDVILMLAHLYGQRKDLQTEEMLLNKALAVDAQNGDIYSALGVVQLKRNPWENAPQAKEFFAKATALDP